MALRWIESKRVVGINEVESTSQEMPVGVNHRVVRRTTKKMDSDFSGLFSLAAQLKLEIRVFSGKLAA
jgi:hypothetical protein